MVTKKLGSLATSCRYFTRRTPSRFLVVCVEDQNAGHAANMRKASTIITNVNSKDHRCISRSL